MFFVQNFGWRASPPDGAALEAFLAGKGLRATCASEAALAVLNSCTVTSTAGEDLRHGVRRVHCDNAAPRILVTGSYG